MTCRKSTDLSWGDASEDATAGGEDHPEEAEETTGPQQEQAEEVLPVGEADQTGVLY